MKAFQSLKATPALLRRWQGYGVTAVLAIILATLIGWLGDAIKGDNLFMAWMQMTDVQYRAANRHWMVIGACAAAIGLVLVLGRNLLSRLGGVEELSTVDHRPARAMVALLSEPNHEGSIKWIDGVLRITLKNGRTTDWPLDVPVGEVVAKLNNQEFRWNWIPLIAAVNQHGTTLKTVVLIASSKSAGEATTLRELLQSLLGQRAPEVRLARMIPSFNNLAQVREAIKLELAEITRQAGGATELRPEHVVINLTGGTKTAGIAAAVAAMDYGCHMEYSEDTLLTYSMQAQRVQFFQ